MDAIVNPLQSATLVLQACLWRNKWQVMCELVQLPRVCTGRVPVILFLLLDMSKFWSLCQNLKRLQTVRTSRFWGCCLPKSTNSEQGDNLVVLHMSGTILCGGDGNNSQKEQGFLYQIFSVWSTQTPKGIQRLSKGNKSVDIFKRMNF